MKKEIVLSEDMLQRTQQRAETESSRGLKQRVRSPETRITSPRSWRQGLQSIWLLITAPVQSHYMHWCPQKPSWHLIWKMVTFCDNKQQILLHWHKWDSTHQSYEMPQIPSRWWKILALGQDYSSICYKSPQLDEGVLKTRNAGWSEKRVDCWFVEGRLRTSKEWF